MEAGGVWGEAGPQAGQLHYLLANVLNIDLYRRGLLEQVALQEFEMQGEVGRNMGRDVARTARDTIRQMNNHIE